MENFYKALKYAVDNDCSDIHMTEGEFPYFRINGSLKRNEVGFEIISEFGMSEIISEMLKNKTLDRKEDIDTSYESEDGTRFRVNIFKQRGKMSLAMRLVKSEPPSIDDLNLPDVIKDFLNGSSGLVLVTGPTGSGKSTTLGAMVDYLNETKECHIITLEDPIEFIHQNKKALINQREIGEDSESYTVALNASLRQDPDVILLGEMRTQDSIMTALTAAETGHLVLSTLHTNDAASTIDRIIDIFPGDRQSQIRVQLAESLVGVVSQRLVKRQDGSGREMALEILVNSFAIKNLIRTSKVFQIKNVMNTNRQSGMITLERSLEDLKASGVIDDEEYNKYLNTSTNNKK